MNWKLVKIFTFRKVSNLLILQFTYLLSKVLGKNVHSGMPMSLSYEPTTTCNLECPECPTGLRQLKRPKGMASLEHFQTTIDELSAYLFNLTFYFQGEPFLAPNLFAMVSYAQKRNIFTMTSTNGHYLTPKNVDAIIEAGLHRLIISMDGATQTTYVQYRKNGNIMTVLEGIKCLEQAKKERKSVYPEVLLQFLVFRTNEHELEAMKSLAKELGVKLQIKSAQINNLKESAHLIPIKYPEHARYRKNKNGEYEIKSNWSNECWRMWSSAVITWNGKVIPCCFDKDATHTMGDNQTQSFVEIWKGNDYREFRKKIQLGRSKLDICRNCTEGLRLKKANSRK